MLSRLIRILKNIKRDLHALKSGAEGLLLSLIPTGRMLLDRWEGKKIVVFHVCSPSQIQFISPIYQELKKRKLRIAYYLACDYPIKNKLDDIDLPFSRCLPGRITRYLIFTDIFLQVEIYGRGPRWAKRIFVGHGQPNKWTNWSEENLRAFDFYFLYGALERSMFEVIIKNHPESTKHIKLLNIGYPKLDAQIQGLHNRGGILKKLGLDPALKTIIYAPSWDPGGSLRTLGIKVVEKLLEIENIHILVKLHPVSMEPEDSIQYEFYTGGVNWQKEFTALAGRSNFRFVKDYLVNPLLSASDVMVTDFSGVALEFMTLDRPVIYIDCPEFYEKTLREWGNDPEVSKNDDRFNAGRNAGIVVHDMEELQTAVRQALDNPGAFSEKRRSLIKRFLYNPGKGSIAAADAIVELLDSRICNEKISLP